MAEALDIEAVIAYVWERSLGYCYGFWKGERKNEIEGVYTRTFDERGLHPASVAWGAVVTCESLVKELAHPDVATSPAALIEAARADAWAEHLDRMGGGRHKEEG